LNRAILLHQIITMRKMIISELLIGTLFNACNKKEKTDPTPEPSNTSATCGTPGIHKSGLTYGTMNDQQGNTYRTIIIGSQEWMAENLNTSVYRNGDSISYVASSADWSGLTSGARAYFNDSVSLTCPNGSLYNGYAMLDARQLCPAGWHLPTDSDWNELIGYLDPAFDPDTLGEQSAMAGGTMKSTSTAYWEPANASRSNSSGFSALPSGFRSMNGSYENFNGTAQWWSSTPETTDSSYFWFRVIPYGANGVSRLSSNPRFGFSVRCVRD
jgi:uncharacterized protein (TIGR02145 family)